MSDDHLAEAETTKSRSPRVATLVAALFIVFLAVAAILVPHLDRDRPDTVFLVVDPLGSSRDESCFQPLTRWLGRVAEYPMRLVVVASLTELADQDWQEVDLVFCPDGVALGLAEDQFGPLAVGRRQVPRNLRPRSVLVSRKAAGIQKKPWLTAPARTILGDSLSLSGCGIMRQRDNLAEAGIFSSSQANRLACGPDPYDHTPVLHAVRLGCFDYAVVRDLAVDKFLKAGLLDPVAWGIEELSAPLPDVVIMVAKSCPTAVRVRFGEVLVGLGRGTASVQSPEIEALAGLNQLGLSGFNLLLENDFSQLRRQFDRQWPPRAK